MSLNIETLLSLFDCYIGGIANYASEIWGTQKGNNVEKVHTDFCNQILGVKKHTSNVVVYAELGTVPLLYNRLFTIVKFWSKVLYSENCILRNCYEKMYTNCEIYKCKNWACDVKKIF
jgi:hypothetical protein